MENQPAIDIILPIYNASEVLPATLDSIARQTYRNIRLICVDDGSTDNTKDLLDRFTHDGSVNTKVISTSNHGSYAARETGLQHVESNLVGFCDAGDLMHPRAMELMANEAAKTHADIVVSAFRRVGRDDIRIEMDGFPSGSIDLGRSSGWLTSVNTSLWNKLVSRKLVDKRQVLVDPPKIGEDALFLMSLYAQASRIAFIDQALYDYNVAENSNMSRLSFDELECMARAWSQTRQSVTSVNPLFAEVIDLAAMVHLGVSAPLIMMGESHAKAVKAAAVSKQILDASFYRYQRSPFVTRAYVKKHPTMSNVRLMHFAVAHGLMPQALGIYGFLRDRLHVSMGW